MWEGSESWSFSSAEAWERRSQSQPLVSRLGRLTLWPSRVRSRIPIAEGIAIFTGCCFQTKSPLTECKPGVRLIAGIPPRETTGTIRLSSCTACGQHSSFPGSGSQVGLNARTCSFHSPPCVPTDSSTVEG